MKTWEELRALGYDKLNDYMVKLGKGRRVHFKMTSTSSAEWVIIPKEDYDQILFDHAEINRLKMKLKTIQYVAEL
jgi:hypothetical protein